MSSTKILSIILSFFVVIPFGVGVALAAMVEVAMAVTLPTAIWASDSFFISFYLSLTFSLMVFVFVLIFALMTAISTLNFRRIRSKIILFYLNIMLHGT